uniref:RAWUL domain-containing protein n=1 Tax=Aegilops tauschii subsp. strangulata TaxID=200361 RepID=A0A453K812_AEGTS
MFLTLLLLLKCRCGFYLHPAEGSPAPNITQGKLSAPRILRVLKVANYVVEKLVLEKPLDGSPDSTFAMGLTSGTSALDSSSRPGLKPWQKLKPSVEILCNNQVLSPEMSLATVRTYIWKKPEDLILNYRVVQSR